MTRTSGVRCGVRRLCPGGPGVTSRGRTFSRVAPWLLPVAVWACSPPVGVGPAVDAGPTNMTMLDAGIHRSCSIGKLTCGANATCVDGVTAEIPSSCQCNVGFEGDGQTCTDINECEGTNT